MAEPTAEWTIIYHGHAATKGRGEFLRLMLEDKGVPYANSSDDLYGPTGWFDAFRGSPDNIDSDINESKVPYPVLYPPAILHRPADGSPPVLINQVGACMMYLGEALGYYPATAAERARASSILMNCSDYIGEGRASFHPVDNFASYTTQKEEADKKSKEFTKSRMLVFLHHFNKVVARAGSSAPAAGGPHVTYADFALFFVLDATVSQFNTEFYEFAWDTANVAALKEYYDWMKDRPNLKAYFASDRCPRKHTWESGLSVRAK